MSQHIFVEVMCNPGRVTPRLGSMGSGTQSTLSEMHSPN